jgi:hypothetical protein
MAGRWRCLLTGSHKWRDHETDEGERYAECVRCGQVRWLPTDEGGVDPLQTPGGGPGGGAGPG